MITDLNYSTRDALLDAMASPQSVHPSALVRLADWSYRRRRLVVLFWIAPLIAGGVRAKTSGGESSMTFSVPAADSQRPQALLEPPSPAGWGDDIDVVFTADG